MRLSRVVLSLASIALVACSLLPEASHPPQPETKEALASYLLFRNGIGVCGAVAVASHALVTAAHCVTPGHLIVLISRTGAVVTARVLRWNPAADSARLASYDALPHHVPEAHPADLESASLVRPFRGWESSPAIVGGEELQWRIYAPVDRGDSGSGVFNALGAVIGVISACDGKAGVCRDTGGYYAPLM